MSRTFRGNFSNCRSKTITLSAGGGPGFEDIVDHENHIGQVDAAVTIDIAGEQTKHWRRSAFEDIVHQIDDVTQIPGFIVVDIPS